MKILATKGPHYGHWKGYSGWIQKMWVVHWELSHPPPPNAWCFLHDGKVMQINPYNEVSEVPEEYAIQLLNHLASGQ